MKRGESLVPSVGSLVFPSREGTREKKQPLARRARARLVHSLSPTAVGGGPTGFPLASPNARPPLPPHHSLMGTKVKGKSRAISS